MGELTFALLGEACPRDPPGVLLPLAADDADAEPVLERVIQDGALIVALEHGLRVGIIRDRKSTRLNSSHSQISYAVFCLKKKKPKVTPTQPGTSSTRCKQ